MNDEKFVEHSNIHKQYMRMHLRSSVFVVEQIKWIQEQRRTRNNSNRGFLLAMSLPPLVPLPKWKLCIFSFTTILIHIVLTRYQNRWQGLFKTETLGLQCRTHSKILLFRIIWARQRWSGGLCRTLCQKISGSKSTRKEGGGCGTSFGIFSLFCLLGLSLMIDFFLSFLLFWPV